MRPTRLLSIALLLGAIACSLSSCSDDTRQEKLYYSEIKSVNKLVLAQMTISKMATIDDINLSEAEGLKQTAAALIDAIKLGDRKAAYSYDTYLRAFIDLSTLTPEDITIDNKAKTVTLTLPAVTTEYLGRDMEIREDHYRVTGLRSEIDARERAMIKEQMNTVLKEEVQSKPIFRDKLINEAKAKARTYFTSLLGKDGYTVTVKFKEN